MWGGGGIKGKKEEREERKKAGRKEKDEEGRNERKRKRERKERKGKKERKRETGKARRGRRAGGPKRGAQRCWRSAAAWELLIPARLRPAAYSGLDWRALHSHFLKVRRASLWLQADGSGCGRKQSKYIYIYIHIHTYIGGCSPAASAQKPGHRRSPPGSPGCITSCHPPLEPLSKEAASTSCHKRVRIWGRRWGSPEDHRGREWDRGRPAIPTPPSTAPIPLTGIMEGSYLCAPAVDKPWGLGMGGLLPEMKRWRQRGLTLTRKGLELKTSLGNWDPHPANPDHSRWGLSHKTETWEHRPWIQIATRQLAHCDLGQVR